MKLRAEDFRKFKVTEFDFSKIFTRLVCFSLSLSLGILMSPAQAEDLLNVEMGMEDAFQDSEAAKLEAQDSLARQLEKEAEQEQAETKAHLAIERAKAKEAQAKSEIAKADTQIQVLKQKIIEAEKQTEKAELAYKVSEEKIAKKNKELASYQMQLEAKEKFLREQNAKTEEAAQLARQKDLEIIALKDKMAKADMDFRKAKEKNLKVQKTLKKTNQNLDRQKSLSAHESYLRALQGPQKHRRNETSRKPSSIKKRTLKLALKNDCNAYSSPDGVGKKVWSGQRGQSVVATAYSQAWAQLILTEGKTAFISKSCF